MIGKQIHKVEKMLQQSIGCTMMELIVMCHTTTPSRRIADLRDAGWTITKKKVQGKNYHRFYGKPPKKTVKTHWQPAAAEYLKGKK